MSEKYNAALGAYELIAKEEEKAEAVSSDDIFSQING